jgi:hypothetical protein
MVRSVNDTVRYNTMHIVLKYKVVTLRKSSLTEVFVSWKRELKIFIQRKPKPESDIMNVSRVLLDFLLSDINV